MIFSAHFNSHWLNNTLKIPEQVYRSSYNNQSYSAHIAIPNYRTRIMNHYRNIIDGDLNNHCNKAEIPMLDHEHYGVIIKFDQAVKLNLHNSDLELDNGIKVLIKQIGTVIIKNAYMDLDFRNRCHRGRFPQLRFHVDRSSAQPTHYSMYSRDPFDEEQKFPRTSSTLFIPAITAHLQGIKEQQIGPEDKGIKPSMVLFENEDMAELRNNIILEHSWNEPQGTGELSMLDNLTSLHCSYFPNPIIKGYKIGVRYLS